MNVWAKLSPGWFPKKRGIFIFPKKPVVGDRSWRRIWIETPMSEHFETDDSTLLDEFRETRNEAAFTEIVRRHLPLVFQAALRRLGTAALAEEAAQHTFACLAAKVAVVSRHPERLRAWLHRTAYFEASTLARKETRLSRLPVESESNNAAMHRPEIYDRLDEALNKLPELDRELVLRHCCGGEDYQRMAAAVGKSQAACQKRVERALARLGQGLGGARTAGVAFAAFAATNLKSEAMPAAERVAAAALKCQSAAGSAAGAFSGMKLGACAALVLAGGAAGWQPQVATTKAPEEVRSVSARSRVEGLKKISKTDDVPLAPRPASVPRTLDDVLETIQAGRFAPLVEFLEHAQVSDLQAIIAEDDFVSSESGADDHFGTARNLALRRWAEIDPEGALRFAITRDHYRPLGDVPEVFKVWCGTDPTAAAAAYGALSIEDQVMIITSVDDPTADRLSATCPRIAWALQEKREDRPNLPQTWSEAEQLLASLSNRNSNAKPTSDERMAIRRAFEIFENQDSATALARAELIPWPEVRAGVLKSIYRNHPPKSSNLPLGALRSQALEREMTELMTSDPEAVIRKLSVTPAGSDRDAINQAVSIGLARSDPWRLIEIARSSNGSLAPAYSALGSAMAVAGGENPQRALNALSEIASHMHGTGGTLELATSLLYGWLGKDPVSAIKWAGSADIMLGTESVTGDTEALIPLLGDGDLEVRRMAMWTLVEQLREKLSKGSAKDLLSKMPPSSADEIVGQLAFNKCWVERKFDESFEIVSMASPEKRRDLLPELAFYALRCDADKAMIWLRSIPVEDRKVISDGIEPHFKQSSDEEIEMIRLHIKQLTP